mmetsp:Transcript_98875/g.176141  ORF Transcript_98875/g.176141 Transcript_98875/m.176141 type:complete len:575 (+) Transcript_98875:95-1819(+)
MIGVCAELAYSKMMRAKEEARQGSEVPVNMPGVMQELCLLGRVMHGTSAASSEAEVLGELWEETDLELVAALAKRGPSRHPKLPGEVQEMPGGLQDALEALRELTSRPGWSLSPCPPVMAAEDSLQMQPVFQRPMPTPARAPPVVQQAPSRHAASQHASNAGPSMPSSGASASSSSFRSASEIFPQPVAPSRTPEGEREKKAPVDFDAVSKSIVGRKGDGTGQKRSHTGEAKESGREWGEAWLRIADADQLERIVPALEATVHRADGRDKVSRSDIAGLNFVKAQIEEVLILPRLHPHLFASALTRPARGLLLFGPPGTGKTLLARWIAAECSATFFNVNASTVMSKWIGEAEKTVKALFQLAADRQPSVIFIDEIDSLLSQRRDADNESSRRVKNEFLTCLEGADTDSAENVLLVGATNMPWELDHAALRRLPKRLYVPLPSSLARASLLKQQLRKHNEGLRSEGALSEADFEGIARRTEGFSGSDLQQLLREAAMGPVREASAALRLRQEGPNNAAVPAVRDIVMQDFECALRRVKPTFSQDQEQKHREFNQEHGTCRGEDAMRDDSDNEMR